MRERVELKSPVPRIGHAGICEGGARQLASLPRQIEGWRGAFLPGRLAQAGSPFNGFAEVGELCGDVGADGCLQRDYVVQNPEGVFAHFFAGEKLGQSRGEVQARLERVGWDGDAELS